MSTNTIDNIATFWIIWMILSLLLGFLGFIFFRNYKVANGSYKKRFLILGIILIIQAPLSFKFGFHLFETIETNAREELIEFLNNSSCRIILNDKELNQVKSKNLINDISKIKKSEPHHSDTEDALQKVTIFCGQEKLTLTLRQDNQIHNEYWVFWDKYRSTKSNELGRILTDNI
ncbi:MAG: hypothetical protein P8Q14_04165 [Vicingaceae bacterium]|nr:hypothetical protein [Vicingaceae bacterium]